MTERMTVSDRDLCTLAGMITEYRADVPAQGLPMSLLSDLKSQIRCDVISFEGFDSQHEVTWFGQAVPDHIDPVAPAFEPAHWQHYWDCQPCS